MGILPSFRREQCIEEPFFRLDAVVERCQVDLVQSALHERGQCFLPACQDRVAMGEEDALDRKLE